MDLEVLPEHTGGMRMVFKMICFARSSVSMSNRAVGMSNSCAGGEMDDILNPSLSPETSQQ
eukprot:6680124-Pyramimonas_sp.AAC.1